MSTQRRAVHVVPFSHLDLFWLGNQEECLSRGNRIISEMMERIDEDQDFRFLLEIVVFVKNFAECHSEKVEKLRALVKDGKVEVGPRWAGIYQNRQSGEDLVRNILYAKQFLRKFSNTDSDSANLGDLPGYTPQYPQILSKAGIHNIIITRGGPKNAPLYFWEGLDGSRVLTWFSSRGYWWARNRGLHMDKEKVQKKELEEEIREIERLTPAPILMHWGIDLILPAKNLSKNIKEWNQSSQIKLKMSTPTQYFREARKTPGIPILSGEVPSVWPARAHGLGVKATNALLSAEKFATVSYLLGLGDYPHQELKSAWQRLLQGMDHNGGGQGAIEGNKRKLEYHKAAIFLGEEILRSSLRLIAENVEVKQGSQCNPIVVFNPLSWNREDLAIAHVTFHGDVEAFNIAKYRNVVLKDDKGNEIPFQYLDVREGVSRDVTISFHAKDIPSLGYNTFYLVPSNEPSDYGKSCQVREEGDRNSGEDSKRWTTGKEVLVLENSNYLVMVNQSTGLVDITDKKKNLEVVRGMRLLALEERASNLWGRAGFTGRIFENAITAVKMVENGPISAKVSIEGNIRGSATKQEIVLYKNIPRIDVVDVISWEPIQALRIQHLFPLVIEDPQVNYGIPYGANSFENIIPNSGPKEKGDEIPETIWRYSREIQKWIDLSNERYGVTIASDGISVEIGKPSLVKFNLVKGNRSPFCRIIKGEKTDYLWRPPRGEYIFGFSLNFHEGNWKRAKSYRKGWELQNPLVCVSVNDPVSNKKFSSRRSFCDVSADNVVVTVLKKSEKSDLPILRLYEAEGKTGAIKVNFLKPLKDVTEVNLLEEEMESLENSANQVTGYEIKTLRLKI